MTLPARHAGAADVFGGRPTKLPSGQSIYRVTGTATINDKEVTPETRVGAGDTVRTGADSEIVFVVGDCAMLQRSHSEVVVEAAVDGRSLLTVTGLRVLTGKLLSVFAPGKPVQIQTATATVGIRGTGAYLEADGQQTYFCTCYGVAEIAARADPESKETVASRHHDRPLYILAGRNTPGQNIRRAPFVNHTDQELALIETLVGRTPPFVFSTREYEGQRRQDYRR